MRTMPPISKFVVVMTGRSGSSYLIDLLNSSHSIDARGEQFSGMRSAKRQLAWLKRVYRDPVAPEIGAIGFKTKVQDILDKDRFAELMREEEARVIVLRRKNIVKSVVSWFNAERLFAGTGEWNLGGERSSSSPINVDSTLFAKRVSLMEQATMQLEEFCERLPAPRLYLHYEDLLTSLDTTLDAVFRFLDVPRTDTSCGIRKNTSDNLREAIANFDEIRTQFIGTRYEEMFDDVCSAPHRA